MRSPLPSRADPWRAAAAGERIEGRLGPERVPRVAGACAGLGEGLVVRLEFGVDEAGTALVDVDVQGVYRFTCQRCLRPMQMARHDRSRVLIARSDDEARALETRGEALTCEPGASLALDALVEDEVLLALPLAPAHEPGQDGSVCRAPGSPLPVPAPEEEAAGRESAGAEEHPFAALAALRGGRPDGNREQ